MPHEPRHNYWTVECRTPSCEKAFILLDYIGDLPPSRIPLLIECKDFVVGCSECKESYSYSRSEVISRICKHDPRGFLSSSSFIEATKQTNA